MNPDVFVEEAPDNPEPEPVEAPIDDEDTEETIECFANEEGCPE